MEVSRRRVHQQMETLLVVVVGVKVGEGRDRKVENFPDSSIYRAKTFRTGKKCVNQIFAIKMCVNYNFAPKRWFNSRFICLSIWKPATKLSDSLF